MSQIEKSDLSELLFDWYRQTEANNILLSFNGDFTQELVNAILLLAEKDPTAAADSTKIRSRIFSILVECMQNITRYGATNSGNDELKPGIVLVCRPKEGFLLRTGNLVNAKQEKIITNEIESVAHLNAEELKKLHKEKLATTVLNEKSGAGLGFITIFRRADKVNYGFKDAGNNLKFFSIDILLKTDTPI